MMDPSAANILIRRAFEARTRFEHGVVQSVDSDGAVNGIISGRESSRTQVGQDKSFDLKPGDRYLSVGSGNFDMSAIFGTDPWIVG